MKIESHYKSLKESLELIEESVQKGILERQRTIGFHCSAAAVDMLEIFLHKSRLIEPGAIIKHDWFSSSNKIKIKFSYDFPEKKKIISLMLRLEEKRNIICYGKPQKKENIEEYIFLFRELEKIFRNLGV